MDDRVTATTRLLNGGLRGGVSSVRRNPGVLVMTSQPLLVTYVNATGRAMVDALHRLECGGPRPGVPHALITFCLDLFEALNETDRVSVAAPFQLDRGLDFMGASILLHGLGMPRSGDVDQARICVLMEDRSSDDRMSFVPKKGASYGRSAITIGGAGVGDIARGWTAIP